MQNTLAQSTKHLMPVTQRPDIMFVRGSGAWLFDQHGKRYLDWVQGWAVNCLGHSPMVLAEALAKQAATLINPGPAFFNQPAAELAALLAEHSCFDHIFFANSGAEANEGAIKLARKWGQLHKNGAFEIITFANGFHGRTLATMSAGGKPGWDRLFAPKVDGFPKATLNDRASVQRLVNDNTVGIMLEPIQGEAGVLPASPEFMRWLRALCDKHGLLLIVDEVQTGCGRTGKLFAYEHFDIEPDIMTLGKGIGGGAPLSALLSKSSCSCFAPGDQGGTYSGNPLICAGGLAVVRTLVVNGFLDSVQAVGQQLAEGLRKLSEEFALGEVRGQGLLLALELRQEIGPKVVLHARDVGMLLNAPRPNCLRFMPALNTTKAEVVEGLRLLRQVFTTLLKEACHD